MTDIAHARSALLARVVEGEGRSSKPDRRAAFANQGLEEPLASLIDRIATRAPEVSDEDVTGVLGAGLTEDELFELAICAAVGQASRQYDTALDALDAAAQDK